MALIPQQVAGTPAKLAALGVAVGSLALAAFVAGFWAREAPAAATPVASPVLDSEPVARHAPGGVLTFTVEGELAAVRADDLATRIAPPDTSADVSADVDPEVYPSPDGRFIATVRRDDSGTWLDVASEGEVRFSLALAGPSDPELRKGKELVAAVDGVPLVIAWSPDSSRLAAGSITGAPWALQVVQAGSWFVESHEVFGGYVGELAWSPDGELLAISTYELDRSDHIVLLFDPRDRTVQQLVRGCSIVWSPDGRYLAVRREPRDVPGLWIASVDGTALTRVTREDASFPVAWTLDSAVRTPR